MRQHLRRHVGHAGIGRCRNLRTGLGQQIVQRIVVNAGERDELVDALRTLRTLAFQRIDGIPHRGLRLRKISRCDKARAEFTFGQLQRFLPG